MNKFLKPLLISFIALFTYPVYAACINVPEVVIERSRVYSDLPDKYKCSSNEMVPFIWDLLVKGNERQYRAALSLLAGHSVGKNRITDWNDPTFAYIAAREGDITLLSGRYSEGSGMYFFTQSVGAYYNRWKHRAYGRYSKEYYEKKAEKNAMKALLSYAGLPVDQYDEYKKMDKSQRSSFYSDLLRKLSIEDKQNQFNAQWAAFILTNNRFNKKRRRSIPAIYESLEKPLMLYSFRIRENELQTN